VSPACGGAWFDDTTFIRAAPFGGATFTRDAWFATTTFPGGPSLDDIRVLNLDDPDLNNTGYYKRRVWPWGWALQPDPDKPTEGRLVRTKNAEETA
jgi:Pentapeptide repeats (9 copies)